MNWPVQLALIAPAFVAATYDVAVRRIPNWLCLVTALVGLAIAFRDGGMMLTGSHALHMALALAVGAALFAIRWIGGGDAKFYAAMAAWFGLGSWSTLLASVALAGLAVLAVWFLYRRLRRYPISPSTPGQFDKLPYGVAISAGAVLAMLVGQYT